MAKTQRISKSKKTAITLENFNNLNPGDTIIDGNNLEWRVAPKSGLITIDAYQCLMPVCNPDVMMVLWHKGKLVDEDYKPIPELNTGKEQIKSAA
ncbi:MAG: hypothetical protein HY973_02350 [Candidatus Kerfeldbacteria bacterium]|nr:hypothetical protein [Candidatus Kerfeldbacteria bacterium]